MKNLRYLDNVSTLELDIDKCIGCSMCTIVCPHSVFEMENKKAKIIDFNGCMECGACVKNCPTKALSVNPGVG
jgi:NAD-dependent dihydropyrimidine dehydrogenase PreA subunit